MTIVQAISDGRTILVQNLTSQAALNIGGVALGSKAFLAPMAGITDAPFRKLAERFGAGLVVSEMIASAALSTGHGGMVRKLSNAGQLPHVVQLAGCEARWMALGAKLAADAGADVIDINFGCPAKRVTNGYAGSALMRVPDLALKLVEAVVTAVPLPVTVKMRLGWDDENLNAAHIAKRAEDAGAQMITVHGRTRQQFYKGTARWALVRPVVEAVKVPVVVNGDIVDSRSARQALEESGAAAVMVGRGAQGQPWRVGQIGAALEGRQPDAAPQGDELVQLIAEHYEMMLTEYGAELGLRVARKHLGWYLDATEAPCAPAIRKSLLTATDPQEVLDRVSGIFACPARQAA